MCGGSAGSFWHTKKSIMKDGLFSLYNASEEVSLFADGRYGMEQDTATSAGLMQ